jgi:Rod binding domain-containing protein
MVSTKLSDDLNDIAQTKAVGNQDELEKTFQDFVGQTFFGQMIASMRATQEDAPYFHGGRAEKIFQGQLDQVLAEELSDSSAAQFSDPMFKLFQLHRK